MKSLIISLHFLLISSFSTAQSDTFSVFSINNVGEISIPSSMELQSKDYKKISAVIGANLGYKIDETRVVFQQKGQNDLTKQGRNTYLRVIVEIKMGKKGDHSQLKKPIPLNEKELQNLSEKSKKDTEESFKSVPNGQAKLLKWNGLSIVTINGQYALKTSFVRQLATNPPVLVESYVFPNNDRQHELILSYRVEEEATWKPIYERILNSFVIKDIR